jgi:hypothetical protein
LADDFFVAGVLAFVFDAAAGAAAGFFMLLLFGLVLVAAI